MNIKHSKKIGTYIFLVALYVIVFLIIYKLWGNLAGMSSIVFLLYVSIKYEYSDVVVLGILMLAINIFIRIFFFNDSLDIGLTVFNYSVVIITSLVISNIIKKNRTIKKQFNEIKTANDTIKTQFKLLEEKMNELTKLKNELMQLSRIDELTGLNNRRSFNEHFIEFWTRAVANSQYLSIIFLDIDFFKGFNDSYGHMEGDKCLKNVANKISKETSKIDFSARYGGEEFIIIIADKTLEIILLVAEHLRASIESLKIKHRTSTVSPYITVSIGVSTVLALESINRTQLVEMADNALYRAKRNGRNCTESMPMILR